MRDTVTMFRLLKWLLVVVVSLLILSGVIRVSFHPERLPEVPARAVDIVNNKSLLESGRSLFVQLKRQGEQWLLRDDTQKLKIATGYIRADANRLVDLIAADSTQPESVLPQATLLVSSIEQVSQLINSSSVEAIALSREEAINALRSAEGALGQLQHIAAEQQAVQERFSAVTAELSNKIGSIAATADNDSSVDLEQATVTPLPTQAVATPTPIPLQF